MILARALRTFGYGCTSVLIAPMLVADGDSPAEIGILLAVTAAGSVLASIALGMFADRLGRRTSLLLSAATMAIAGIAFSWSESYPLLLVAGFVGTLSPSTNDNTPFSGVEQSVLAQTCPDDRHTAVFARYNMIALLAGALGGLAAAGLSTLTWVEPGDVAFGVYAGLAVVSAIVFAQMSPAAEARPRAEPAPELADTTPLHPVPRAGRATGPAVRLAGLFAVDAFAGGLAVQAILALWLQQRYSVSTVALGVLFFVTNLLSALSQALAPALARRRGLLQTMLVPHLVSNVLLLAVTVAPSFRLAALLLAARHALSKIDVPARQAFTAAVVSPQQRTAAASLTTVARSVATSASPLTSSLLLSGPLLAFGAPLLAGGALALTYDVTMWCNFRSEPAGRERAAQARSPRGRHRARKHRVHAGHAPGRGVPVPPPASERLLRNRGRQKPAEPSRVLPAARSRGRVGQPGSGRQPGDR